MLKKTLPALLILVLAAGLAWAAGSQRDRQKDDTPAPSSPQQQAADALEILNTFKEGTMEPLASPFLPPGHGGTPPGQGGVPPGQTTPPGHGGTPPGQGGTPPGQGGGPPPGHRN